MSPELIRFLEQAEELESFDSLSPQNINAVNCEGENVLHLAIHQNNTEIANQLIKEGINIHQPGDLGRTPLHEACAFGNMTVVNALVAAGADLFSLTEGYPPFTLARFGGHDEICDYLAGEMKNRQTEDPKIWIKARMKQLRVELERLERKLAHE